MYATDPLTGDVLWQRGSIERGSRIAGDDETLFVAALPMQRPRSSFAGLMEPLKKRGAWPQKTRAS